MNTYAHIMLKGLRILHTVAYLINDILRGCFNRGGGGLACAFNVWNPLATEKKQKSLNEKQKTRLYKYIDVDSIGIFYSFL